MKRTLFPIQRTGTNPLPKPKIGAPTKYTPEVGKQILTFIRLGNYVDVAAMAVGVSQCQVRDWIKKGSSGHRVYKQFVLDMQQAVAESEQRDLSVLDAAALAGWWQAAAWKLERKFPNRWGRVHKVEMTGPEGGPIKTESKMDLGKLSVEQLLQLREIVDIALDSNTQAVVAQHRGNGTHG